MGKNDRGWIPDAVDLDWIESLAPPLPTALGGPRGGRAREPHPDRRPRRRARAVRAGRVATADRRGRHRVRLLDAVDGARPAGRRDDRDHRSGPRADRPRPRLVAAGRHRRRADHRRQRAGARGDRDATRRWPARSTWSSSTPSSPNTRRISPRSATASSRARWSPPTTSCGAAARRAAGRSRRTTPTPRRCGRSTRPSSPIPRLTATILPVGDGLLVATWHG